MSHTKAQRAQYMKELRQRKREESTEASRLRDELTASYKENRKRLTDALATLRPGTSVFLQYAKAIEACDRSHREELVSRGLSVENLGVATNSGWRFSCSVASDSAVNVIELRPGQTPPPSTPFPKRSKSDLEGIKALDEEFGFASDNEKE